MENGTKSMVDGTEEKVLIHLNEPTNDLIEGEHTMQNQMLLWDMENTDEEEAE